MILVTKTTTGLLLQQDATTIEIDAPAIPSALPAIIATLIDSGRALGQARRAGYEAGLVQGREQARIEYETGLRIAARQAEELIDALAIGGLAQAA